MNMQNEHSALQKLVDGNDDIWRSMSLVAILLAGVLPTALFATLVLWWFDWIRLFWWSFAAVTFSLFAAVLVPSWLYTWLINLGILSVRLSGTRAARAYNRSLERLADSDMDRPILVEPDIEDIEAEIIEPPIMINGPQGTQFLPRDDSPGANILGAFNRPQLAAVSTMEQSIPAGLSRRQQLEQQYGIDKAPRQAAKATVKPRRKMMTLADGVAVDVRDLAYFVRNAYTVGTGTDFWRKQFGNERYTNELKGQDLQKHVFDFFEQRGVLIRNGKQRIINPDYANADEILAHLGLV